MRPVRSVLFSALALVALAAGWFVARYYMPARWETPYECYQVEKGTGPNIQVETTDQIGSTAPLVMQADLLCNPTKKVHVDGSKPRPVKFADHLQCYGIDSKKTGPWVEVTTQFGKHAPFKIGKAMLLCEPADKCFNRPPPPPDDKDFER